MRDSRGSSRRVPDPDAPFTYTPLGEAREDPEVESVERARPLHPL